MKCTILGNRLFNKLTYAEDSTCWLWNGTKDWNGYGKIRFNNKMQYVHRVAFQLFKGPLAKGLVVDHICNIKSCVNPIHLQLITQTANVLRSNAFSGINHRKQFCPKGHKLQIPNLDPSELKRGGRRCLICSQQQHRNSYVILKKHKDSNSIITRYATI